MELIPKIGITGLPRVGKTEALIKIAGRLEKDYVVGGMITETIKEEGERVGFKVVDWRKKEEKLFAHINLDSIHRLGKYNIDLKRSYIVGDTLKDIQTGKAASCKTVLVLTGYGKEEQKKLDSIMPDMIFKNLKEFAINI